MQQSTIALIGRYYAAFNAEDMTGMLALLADNVVHDINQGARETGKPAFRAFLERMNACYRERLTDIVVMSSPDGARAGAEFTVRGEYLRADEGLPPARRRAGPADHPLRPAGYVPLDRFCEKRVTPGTRSLDHLPVE